MKDIYNGDESGLSFRQLPTRALMKKMRKGKKLNKLRATLNFIVNALGTDIHIQPIGSAARPRAFGKTMRPYDSYGIDYYNQRKSWMNSEIFFKVIQKFSNRVQRKKNRNVLLIMDNFSGHKLPEDKITKLTFDGGFRGFQYKNVMVLFLPPNVTSVCQPLHQGVISTFKAHYRRQHVAWVLQQYKNDVDPKKIKVRTHIFPSCFDSTRRKLTIHYNLRSIFYRCSNCLVRRAATSRGKRS